MAGCYGLQLEDGTRYTANRQGAIEVDRRDHLKAIKAMGTVDFHEATTGFADAADDGRFCSRCGFHGWKWQAACPRDGAAMIPPEEFIRTHEEGVPT